MSWGWQKILQLRLTIRRFIWSKIGNGANTSLRFDRWTDLEPIGCLVSHRDMARSGLTPNSKVHDVIIEGTWLWSHDLIAKFPVLNYYNVPINDKEVDRLVWRDSHGTWLWSHDLIAKFPVLNYYNVPINDKEVDRLVWRDSHVRRKLKTQDLILVWDVSSSLGVVCSLCESNMDSHDHLFFECSVACGIWNRVKGLAGLNASNSNIYDIIQDLLSIVRRRTTVSVIAKLVVAALAYYVWQERNWRLFKKGKRNSDQIVECIVSFVRLKLLSCKLKKSKSSERMAMLWDLPKWMRTRSSSNLPGESSTNPTSSNPKRRNRRRSKQPFILEESLVDTKANQRTVAELLRAPIEGYVEAIVVPPIFAEHFELKQSLINMMTSDQFFRLE
nr:hypothetical protein [Tanacetum cinerariifolium]